MSRLTTHIPVTQEVLKEIEQIALVTPIKGIDKLEYSQAQTAMTVNAIVKWLASYGIEANFKLDI